LKNSFANKVPYKNKTEKWFLKYPLHLFSYSLFFKTEIFYVQKEKRIY